MITAMNFSEFSEAFDKSKKKKYAKQPKKRQDNPGDKNIVGQTHPYDIIGATGMDGDNYAWAENIPPNNVTEMSQYSLSSREQKVADDREKAAKDQDNRMRYGKKGRPTEDAPLRKGEVRRWDKVKKQWVSNKD